MVALGMVYLTLQQELIGLLASAVQLPNLSLERQLFYQQMLDMLTNEVFSEADTETMRAMGKLMAEARAELHWE